MRTLRALTLAGALVLAATGEALAAEGGIELIPDWRLLLVLVVGFGLLVIPLNGLLFRPILRVLDEREERIAGTRRRAESTSRQAEEVMERYQREIAKARAEADRERTEKLEQARGSAAQETAAAREETERRIDAARAELGRALDDARASLRPQAESLAREAAAQVLGRPL